MGARHAFLAVGVDVLHVGVGLVLVVIFVVVVIIIASSAAQVLLQVLQAKQLPQLLVVEGVGEVLAHALEASEASLRPLGVVADIDASVLVELIGVGGKDGVQREGVALGELDAQACVEVAPGLPLGCHVVAERESKLVDETDFLLARGVAAGAYLHLDVVGEVELHAAGHAAACCAIDAVAEGGVGDGGDIAVGIGADVGVVEAPHGFAEVGSVTKGEGGRHHVAYGLYLLAAEPGQWRIEAIELCVGAEAHIEVEDVVEAVDGVALDGSSLLVPRLHDFVGIHAVGEGEVRADVDVLGHGEGCADGYLVAHTVAPVLDETALEEEVLLGVDAVGQRSGVAHGYLLVPSLLAHHLLALEGVEAVELYVEGGQCDGDAAVAHVL